MISNASHGTEVNVLVLSRDRWRVEHLYCSCCLQAGAVFSTHGRDGEILRNDCIGVVFIEFCAVFVVQGVGRAVGGGRRYVVNGIGKISMSAL